MGDFRDAWLEVHEGREPARGSRSEWDRREALTFPCCNPVKRIDFVLYRNGSHRGDKEEAGLGLLGLRAVRAGLAGQDPTADTQGQESRGGGMLDPDSPVWASDHRAVYADFEFVPVRPP